MKKIVITTLALLGVAILAGCNYGGSSTTSMPATPPAASTQSPAVSGNTVVIQNFSFIPGTLTVTKGTTVTWTNHDATAHQIKSATFNSSLLSTGQSFSFTFDTAGSFDYSCAIHPSMLGKIIVQ